MSTINEQKMDAVNRLKRISEDTSISLRARNDIVRAINWIEEVFSEDYALVPKGERMPQTPAQFARMGNLYEQALMDRDKEIAILKQTVNDLRQKYVRPHSR